jgi:hypothetical protein
VIGHCKRRERREEKRREEEKGDIHIEVNVLIL